MAKFIQPGSGADDMGAGIGYGCFRWTLYVMVAAIIIGLLFKYVF